MGLKENLDSRQRLLSALRAEVLGPDPVGERREIPSKLTLEEFRAWGPATQLNGEEVLTLDTPSRRYGAGILHLEQTQDDLFEAPSGGVVAEVVDSNTPVSDTRKMGKTDTSGRSFREEGDDFGIAAANGFKPSAVGVSFVVDIHAIRGDVVVTLANRVRQSRSSFTTEDCGYYRPHGVQISSEGESTARPWWLRFPLVVDGGGRPSIRLTADKLRQEQPTPIDIEGTNFPGKLQVQVNVRGWPGAPTGQRLVTVSLRNRRIEGAASGVDASCLFQSGLVVAVPDDAIRAYPEAQIPLGDDGTAVDDHSINRLIYRKRKVHAVGHGCSADWDGDGAHIPGEIWTDFTPVYEMAPMAFDVHRGDESKLKLSMRELGDAANAESLGTLGELVDLYENWILEREAEACTVKAENTALGRTADEMNKRCRQALVRMRIGVDVLASDESAMSAFQLTNQAMLMAQHRRPKDARKPNLDRTGVASWPGAYLPLDMASPSTVAAESPDLDRPVGLWRPFQLAFLLMSLDGVVNDQSSVDREIVDLIWFPTGGGKTEAYLGLTAFTVLYNALTGRSATQAGQRRAVSVLMRYTLRLLTAQQFQRAVTLFCALELLRSADEGKLGDQRFTVGLWVGGSSTPNKSDDAGRALKLMDGSARARPDEDADQNPFVLLQCPWCSSAFGRQGGKPNSRYESIVHGYQITDRQAQKFRFACPDRACEFGIGKNVQIPALVVDEDIYRVPPTLLIGTVDKFAMLAWKPEIRSLFGIGNDGERQCRAPDLIIQDELHLMTGPLGTMVGLFEVVVEAMCRHDGGTSPKVIASTATAARAAEQVLGLYARKDTSIFPPTGLDASDSFFAKEDTESPGRLYVGVLAPGHGSMQTTQARTYSALMQAVANIAAGAEQELSASLVDPWWSLLAYYNSLRELGGALTLFGADIPEYLRAMHRRNGTPASARRWIQPDRVMELTSRLRSDEVPEALRSMERELTSFRNARDGSRALYPPYDVIDACLASNIVEVGVDVPRLSLMALVGQPKTTSSYIQASSRVGRRDDRPGLIVMLYSTTKPRDRSHYEKFRTYHQSIYAWVEPTSVTPYSPPALERAMHAVLVAMMRQMSSSLGSPPNVISNAGFVDEMGSILLERAAIVARADEVEGAARILQARLRQWRSFDPPQWGNIYRPDPAQPGLLYPSGKERPQEWGHIGWSTPTSLRDVDASCEAEVTQYYAELSAREDQ